MCMFLKQRVEVLVFQLILLIFPLKNYTDFCL